MARRGKKYEEDLINVLLFLPPVVTFLILSVLGVRLQTTLIVAGVVFCAMLGILIARKLKWDEKLKKSGIADIDKMDGIQFEHYLGMLFNNHGYKVTVTKSAGDYGADLVIAKDGKKIVVQAKRYSKNVSLKAVQEAVTSKAHYDATEAWVVTNSGFTQPALNLARSNNVKMLDREELVEMIAKMNPGSIPDPQKVMQEVSVTSKQVCERCGSAMALRKGPRGKFLGCSKFPKCRGTVQI